MLEHLSIVIRLEGINGSHPLSHFWSYMDENDTARAPRYEGEDVSPTTDRELKGWYSTGLAAEIFAVCGVGKYMGHGNPFSC